MYSQKTGFKNKREFYSHIQKFIWHCVKKKKRKKATKCGKRQTMKDNDLIKVFGELKQKGILD